MKHQNGVAGLGPGVSVWSKSSIGSLPQVDRQTITELIDTAGVRSGRAQGLPGAITSVVRTFISGRRCFLVPTSHQSFQDASRANASPLSDESVTP